MEVDDGRRLVKTGMLGSCHRMSNKRIFKHIYFVEIGIIRRNTNMYYYGGNKLSKTVVQSYLMTLY